MGEQNWRRKERERMGECEQRQKDQKDLTIIKRKCNSVEFDGIIEFCCEKYILCVSCFHVRMGLKEGRLHTNILSSFHISYYLSQTIRTLSIYTL